MKSESWKKFSESMKVDSSPACYVLMPVAIVVALAIPSSFFNSNFAKLIIGFEFSILPKLNCDLQVIKSYSSEYLASRYVFLYVISQILFIPLIIYCIVFAREGTMLPRSKPLTFNSKLLVIRILAVIAFAYFLFFDSSVATSDTRIGRAIFHGPAFIFWVPGLFSALTNAVQITVQHIMHRKDE